MFTGVVEDNRTPAQKEFDYKHEEVFTSSVPQYFSSKSTASSKVEQYPTDDQKQTSSCVAHGKVLVTSIFKNIQQPAPFQQLSSMYIYRNRVNFPDQGMVPANANMLTIQKGAPIFADLPTPQTEDEANALSINAAIDNDAANNKGGKWVQLIDPTDIDTMAFVSNNLGLPLNILIFATLDEWSTDHVVVKYPDLTRDDPIAIVKHCITILPKSAYMDALGVKHVIIQDSALFGGFKDRDVSENFIKQRTYECDYMIALGSIPINNALHYQFSNDLTVGSTGPDVLALQTCLQALGYFPNVVNGQPLKPTSYFGGMTKHAVQMFQNSYATQILTPNGLTTGSGYCGSSTRTELNKLFS